MASTNGQILALADSPSFKHRLEGWFMKWARANFNSGTASKKTLARAIMQNVGGYVTTHAQAMCASDNVGFHATYVTTLDTDGNVVNSVSDADLESQVNTRLDELA